MIDNLEAGAIVVLPIGIFFVQRSNMSHDERFRLLPSMDGSDFSGWFATRQEWYDIFEREFANHYTIVPVSYWMYNGVRSFTNREPEKWDSVINPVVMEWR